MGVVKNPVGRASKRRGSNTPVVDSPSPYGSGGGGAGSSVGRRSTTPRMLTHVDAGGAGMELVSSVITSLPVLVPRPPPPLEPDDMAQQKLRSPTEGTTVIQPQYSSLQDTHCHRFLKSPTFRKHWATSPHHAKPGDVYIVQKAKPRQLPRIAANPLIAIQRKETKMSLKSPYTNKQLFKPPPKPPAFTFANLAFQTVRASDGMLSPEDVADVEPNELTKLYQQVLTRSEDYARRLMHRQESERRAPMMQRALSLHRMSRERKAEIDQVVFEQEEEYKFILQQWDEGIRGMELIRRIDKKSLARHQEILPECTLICGGSTPDTYQLPPSLCDEKIPLTVDLRWHGTDVYLCAIALDAQGKSVCNVGLGDMMRGDGGGAAIRHVGGDFGVGAYLHGQQHDTLELDLGSIPRKVTMIVLCVFPKSQGSYMTEFKRGWLTMQQSTPECFRNGRRIEAPTDVFGTRIAEGQGHSCIAVASLTRQGLWQKVRSSVLLLSPRSPRTPVRLNSGSGSAFANRDKPPASSPVHRQSSFSNVPGQEPFWEYVVMNEPFYAVATPRRLAAHLAGRKDSLGQSQSSRVNPTPPASPAAAASPASRRASRFAAVVDDAASSSSSRRKSSVHPSSDASPRSRQPSTVDGGNSSRR